MSPHPDRDKVINLLLQAPSAAGLSRDDVAAWVDENVIFNDGGRGFRLRPTVEPAVKPKAKPK